MVEHITCRLCRKQFHVTSIHNLSCPHCHPSYSPTRYGVRQHQRMTCMVPFSVTHGNRVISAHTIDISKGGLGIKLFESPHIRVGESLLFYIPAINVQARNACVVWCKSWPRDFGLDIRLGAEFF